LSRQSRERERDRLSPTQPAWNTVREADKKKIQQCGTEKTPLSTFFGERVEVERRGRDDNLGRRNKKKRRSNHIEREKKKAQKGALYKLPVRDV
jgi:hypothetical protein